MTLFIVYFNWANTFLLQIRAGMYKKSVNDYQTKAIQSVVLHPGYNPSMNNK